MMAPIYTRHVRKYFVIACLTKELWNDCVFDNKAELLRALFDENAKRQNVYRIGALNVLSCSIAPYSPDTFYITLSARCIKGLPDEPIGEQQLSTLRAIYQSDPKRLCVNIHGAPECV